MKEAILIAIENGYVYPYLRGQMTYSQKFEETSFGKQWLKCYGDFGEGEWAVQEIILLDPLFWQALGKGFGWKSTSCGHTICETEDTDCEKIPQWKYHWHRFIDNLAQGKDIDSFFSPLLPTN